MSADVEGRRYRIGDTVLVVSPDPRWAGRVGTVTRADYGGPVPLVVDLPTAPDCPQGIGICFRPESVQLVEAVDPEADNRRLLAEAIRVANNACDSAADFLASPWLREALAGAWDAGYEGFAAQFVQPMDEAGLRPRTPNPYRDNQTGANQ